MNLVLQQKVNDAYLVFHSIPSDKFPETTAPAAETTRIQFRFPDGRKSIRRFNLNDKVSRLFQFIKGDFPGLSAQAFDLMHFREPLLNRCHETIQEAKLGGSSLVLDYIS